jgi:polyferredoxin
MRLSRLRTLLQASSAVFSNGYAGSLVTRYVNTNQLKGVCVPYLNCYACPSSLYSCPIGTLQHFMAIRTVPVMLLGMLGLVGLTTGRMACGWACPFGFFQELLHRIPTRKYSVPKAVRHLKWFVLAFLVLLAPMITGDTWFCKICPAGSLLAGLPWVAWNPANPVTGSPVLQVQPDFQFLAVMALLMAFLIWFVFSKRPFCKTLCPLGAILALFNGVSMVRLEVASSCDSCATCNSVCPMDLDVTKELNSVECIRCLECTKCGHVRIVPPFKDKVGSHVEADF